MWDTTNKASFQKTFCVHFLVLRSTGSFADLYVSRKARKILLKPLISVQSWDFPLTTSAKLLFWASYSLEVVFLVWWVFFLLYVVFWVCCCRCWSFLFVLLGFLWVSLICLFLCGWGVILGVFGCLVFGFGVSSCSLLNSCTGTVTTGPIYAEQWISRKRRKKKTH